MEIVIVSTGIGNYRERMKELNEEINLHIKKGFRLHGSTYAMCIYSEIVHYQAMIKEERMRD